MDLVMVCFLAKNTNLEGSRFLEACITQSSDLKTLVHPHYVEE
jgi:hypothetical protein